MRMTTIIGTGSIVWPPLGVVSEENISLSDSLGDIVDRALLHMDIRNAHLSGGVRHYATTEEAAAALGMDPAGRGP